MDVVIVGGHGQIALRLTKLLAARGDRVRGVIRNPDHAADVEAAGGEAVVCDIEKEELTEALEGADAVVFAAGAGPGSGPARKQTVDLEGALKLVEAAKANGISRYVIVSSIGAHDPSLADGDFRAYLQAKHDADEALAASGLDYTIVRPGSLSDEPGDGRVEIRTELGHRAPVSRDDVAAALAEALASDNTIGATFELFDGETPIPDAIRAL